MRESSLFMIHKDFKIRKWCMKLLDPAPEGKKKVNVSVNQTLTQDTSNNHTPNHSINNISLIKSFRQSQDDDKNILELSDAISQQML